MPLTSMLALLPICAAALRSPPLPIGSTLAPAVSRPALLPRGVLTAGTAQVRVRDAVRMFAEPPPEEPEDEDMFEDLLNELTAAQKIIKALPEGTVKTGAVALPLLISLLGWVVAPQSMGRFSTLFGLAGGTAGFKAGQKLRKLRRGVVPAAIAQMIQDEGIRNLDPNEVGKLADKYGVGTEQFEEQLVAVYGRFLRELLQEDGVAVSQVSELGSLRRGLGLEWNATQAAHASEAVAMVGGTPAPSVVATPPAQKKLAWLTETLFATSKGKAKTAELEAALGLRPGDLQVLVSQLSTPLYRNAITQAVGKYNASDTPAVLEKVRGALCLAEQSSEQVHNAMYDAQLAMMLPADDEEESKFTDDKMQLLGELEGILQVRSAQSRVQAHTMPLFRSSVVAALDNIMAGTGGEDATPGAVWARLATRQQELRLPGPVVEATVIEAARGVAAVRLELAAEQQMRSQAEAARASVASLLQYGSFVGQLLEFGSLGDNVAAPRRAEQYLGALCLDTEESEAAAQQLAEEAISRGEVGEDAELLKAMLALSAPELEGTKREHAELLEKFVALGNFDSNNAATRSWQDKLRASAEGLPVALRQKLALDAYYTWLADLSEQMDRKTVEQAAALRSCLQVQRASLVELYSKTAVDQLVLARCCEQLLEERSPLSAPAQQWMVYMEGQLGSVPGTADLVMAAKNQS